MTNTGDAPDDRAPDYISGPNGHHIAYYHRDGRGPAIMFCGGFMSDMTGSKATTLEAWAEQKGHAFVRFDYSGHGASGGQFKDGTIGQWRDDALFIFDTLLSGPVILVGSSMGGWIASLIARARPDRVAGFVGIAAAPDFTERMWTHDLDDGARKTVLDQGFVEIASDYGPDPYVFTRVLFDDGRANRVMAAPLKIAGPVRLIQGTADLDVPWQTAENLGTHMKASGTDDVEVILVPGGDHRLSSDRDLARLVRVVAEIAVGRDKEALYGGGAR